MPAHKPKTKKKSFPDLSGDGKTTMKDILIGRGVIKKGDTIGVMAWDTIRYLEFFFTIPMMGAILHTINIIYTLKN